MRVRIGILLTLISILSVAYAQQYEFSVSAVGTGYMGDINPKNPLYYNNIGASVSAKYNFNSTLGIHLAYSNLRISGSDRDNNQTFHQRRNLSFNNNLSEIALVGEFNFFRYIPGQNLNVYTPYITLGIASVFHDPYILYNDNKIMLRELQLEADAQGQSLVYNKVAFAIPVGIGFKYNIKGPWTLAADISYRTVLNDNIDNVSQYYNQLTSIDHLPRYEIVENGVKRPFNQSDWNLLADPSGMLIDNRGTSRGDGKKFDSYMTAGFKLSYTILSSKCYWWQ